MELEIKGFIETSFLDWDGKVVSTLYVPHCNFHCPFCHNYGLIEDPKQYETIPIEKIENYLKGYKDFIDGICLTGGEPCMHKNRGLFDFLHRIKDLGFGIKFDSNGTDPECLKRVIEEKLADYIAMDIKGPLDVRYDKLSGVKTDLEKIKKSIEIIMKCGLPYEFRTTIVPTLLGSKEMRDIAEYLSGAKKFILQQFAPKNSWDESLRGIKSYEREKLEELQNIVKPFVANVLIRGE
ncbi:MAG: anaerobic ribonucleoside-triphosphate reductase activating protein [Candidatus Saganbacteria bacterium]|nr:anaerobic ribonucleoside-triphosphate reductase activating protein [Candidatus Saganbacteria bacterium]